jgi:hypothetical protein
MPATLDYQMPLRVRNIDSSPITIGWGNVYITIEPGEQKLASLDHVINYFGDPRAIENTQNIKHDSGVVGFIPDRKSEVRRLQCKWGNTFAQDESHIYGPAVEVYTLDGDRVWTVMEDPDGHHASPTLMANEHQLSLEAQINRMQSQLDMMIRLQQAGEETIEPAEEPMPDDEEWLPKNLPRAKAKSAVDDE